MNAANHYATPPVIVLLLAWLNGLAIQTVLSIAAEQFGTEIAFKRFGKLVTATLLTTY